MCLATCPNMNDSNFAHCGGCHETFATLADFDKHRTLRNPQCIPPSELGLTLRHGLWIGTRRVDLTMFDVKVDRWKRATEA